jgi:radical SAM superfamily enzyme YgiQ (UPF0313 family)
MELPRREANDIYLADGTFRGAVQRLRRRTESHDLRIGIVYPFDYRTRMLPYWYADKRMAPCSVRTLADVLDAAGFKHLRIILQQWTPNFKPSKAMIDGRGLDLLLISTMQVHAEPAFDMVRDAHTLGDSRPLIIVGGPKAIYEPTDCFELGPKPGVGADCAVTGEVFVLLDLLEAILKVWIPGRSIRAAFEQTRRSGALNGVPGLVYLHPDSPPSGLVAVSTGVQRLLRDLDELPMPDAGYRLLEPPHRGRKLRDKPYPAAKVVRRSAIASLLTTQGCKFSCSFCPIPGVNQRTWRHKSPGRFAAEIKHLYEQFGIREFFGTDDNFFNDRQTVVDLMGELARTTTADGVSIGKRIRFYTEATEFDVHKNRDLLPFCRDAGLRGIWFGIEDITAKLVNKGQTADKTVELFRLLHEVGIQPMALMIHSDDQPVRSARGTLAGVLNQSRYLFKLGAVSYQCTYLGPAVGTRGFEAAAKSGTLFKKVGGKLVPQAFQDGNHVAASGHAKPWQRQINILRAYATFYNPWNTCRILGTVGRDPLAGKKLLFQVIGQIGLLITIPRLLAWALKLKRGPLEVWDGLQLARIPMIDAASRKEAPWSIEYLPAQNLPALSCPLPAV